MSRQSILFHGRHLLHTRFQADVLRSLVQAIAERAGVTPEVVFAITSANHANSRYNPIPFHYRAIGVDRFATETLADLGASWRIVPIPHFPPSNDFAKRVLSYVEASDPSRRGLLPETTTVFCSTPALIEQFERLGYVVETAEYDRDQELFTVPTPQSLLQQHGQTMRSWKELPSLQENLALSTARLWNDYPDIPNEIEHLWNETLLTEHGDITETRDYATYSFSMSRSEVIDRKYEDIRSGIVPGIIVDEGRADGALLARIAADFPDSDLIGIEITREFIAEAQERQRQGGFGRSFVFFYQRNLNKPIFPDESVDTTICNSTTHEIWSYGGGDATLREYLKSKYDQLKPGGALIIRDVIGPENGDEEIYAWWNDSDGVTPSPADAASLPVKDLSTRGRFYRYANEFFNGRGVVHTFETIDSKQFCKLARKDAADFMSKKNYPDNWESELHESFTHWSMSRWEQELADAGFTVDEGMSHTYLNSWIVENHFMGTAELYRMEEGNLVPEPFSPTTVVLVARK